MKKIVLNLDLEIKDIQVLRYINKRTQAKKEKLIKKFGEYRIQALSEHTQENPSLIYEEVERTEVPAPWSPEYGPPTDLIEKPLGIYKLTPEGISALENANAKTWRERIRIYIPISISILSLIISLFSLLCSE